MTNKKDAVELNDESLDQVNGGGLIKTGPGTLTLPNQNSPQTARSGGSGAGKVSMQDLHLTTK